MAKTVVETPSLIPRSTLIRILRNAVDYNLRSTLIDRFDLFDTPHKNVINSKVLILIRDRLYIKHLIRETKKKGLSFINYNILL